MITRTMINVCDVCVVFPGSKCLCCFSKKCLREFPIFSKVGSKPQSGSIHKSLLNKKTSCKKLVKLIAVLRMALHSRNMKKGIGSTMDSWES